MIVLDASVLIAYLTTDDAFHPRAVQLLKEWAEQGEVLLVNPVTLAEVLVAPARAHQEEEAIAALTELGISEAPFPAGAALALARLRGTGVKMPDCCVLLTAMERKAAVATFDDCLLGAAMDLIPEMKGRNV